MKTVFVFLLSTATAFAQTTLIAHKSHSGTAASFAMADPGNFGAIEIEHPLIYGQLQPVPVLVKITKLSDSTVVMTTEQENVRKSDTIYNHPVFSDPNMSVDTMKTMFGNVEFENFDKKPEDMQAEPLKETNGKPVPPKKATTSGTKNKSSLIWLWIIGGGTFAGILLATRKRSQTKLTYA